MPTHKELKDFVKRVADGCCDPVLSAQAQILLKFNIEPFNGNMVDDLVNQAYWDDKNDENSRLDEEMEALKLKYGDQPLLYMIEGVRSSRFDNGLDLAISWVGHVHHAETLETRRLLLEELLPKETAPRMAYYILVSLMNIKDIRSLKVVEAYHNEDKHGKVMFHLSQQVIDYLKKDN